MFKWFWWAPVIVFTGLVVSVHWAMVDDAASRATVVEKVKVAPKPMRRTVAKPRGSTTVAAAVVRPLGATVLMSQMNPLGWSHAYPEKRNIPPYGEYVGTNANAIADVTGDGRNDLVALSLENHIPEADFRVWVYAQTPSGNLAAPVGYRYVEGLSDLLQHYPYGGMAVDDFNDDGTNDIVVGYSFGIAVLISDRKGGFTQTKHRKPNQLRHLHGLASIDIDRDGDKDLIGFTQFADYTVFTNDGRGGFTSKTVWMGVPADTYYLDHKVVDMDGDGYQDLIVLWRGNGSKLLPAKVAIYRNDGTLTTLGKPAFGDLEVYVSSYSGIAAGDFDHDGRKEIVVSVSSNIPTAELHFVDSDAGGNWALSWKLPTYSIPNSLWVGDLDGDGREDLLTDHLGWSQLTEYSNFDFSKEVVLVSYANSPFTARVIAVGDLNSDGCKDVAVSDIHTAQKILWTEHCHRHKFLATDSGWKQRLPQ